MKLGYCQGQNNVIKVVSGGIQSKPQIRME